VIGLARAAELAVAEREAHCQKLEKLRDRLEAGIVASVPDVVVHGRGGPRAPHIVNVSIPGTDSESLLMALDLRGVGCSAGSACQSGSVSPSHVLSAIGVANDLASAALRMSVGVLTTEAAVDRVVEIFPALVAKVRGASAAAAADLAR
jgi:cysteine desulfurase